MPQPELDRRTLLKLGTTAAVGALLSAATPALLAASEANRSAGKFQHLEPSVARTLEAVTARILPTTDTPGAREAGAVWFIDAMGGGTLKPVMTDLAVGAAALDSASGGSFAALTESEQNAHLRTIEDGEFFALMHMLTLAGTFTMSRHGGNRGEVGWDILGFQRQHHWQVPFGYYDAQVHGTPEAAQ